MVDLMTETWVLFHVLVFSLMYRFYGYWGFVGAVGGSFIAHLFI
jgi:hypothetical protein